ncbi:unnamed protein product [Effrenium voratum]|nr:unnamed protein product [Effrenium voratum]
MFKTTEGNKKATATPTTQQVARHEKSKRNSQPSQKHPPPKQFKRQKLPLPFTSTTVLKGVAQNRVTQVSVSVPRQGSSWDPNYFQHPKVYCDLDGVLADFNKGCLALFPEGGCIAEKIPTHTVTRLSYEEESEMWRRVESKSDFFLSLDWTSDGQELWRWIDWNVVPPAAVLTGLPLGRAGQMAAKQKEQWCLQRLGAHVSVFCCGTRNKQKFSGPNCVLIDDRNDLREAWEARGGVFIHHTSAAESIRQLKEVLLRGAEKNRQAVNHMPLQLTSVCWASQTPAGCFKSNCRYLHVPISRRHRCWIQLWGFVWWRLRLEELAFGSAPLRGILWLGSDAGVAFWWSTRLLLLLGTYFFFYFLRF